MINKSEKECKRINFDLPVEIHVELKAYCAKNGITIKEFISNYIKEFLEQEKNSN